MKKCTICSLVKDLSCFHIRRASKDGYKPQCKSCVKISTDKDKVKLRNKQWKQENPDKIQKWREDNPEKLKEYSKRSQAKESTKKYQREWFRRKRKEDPIFNLTGRLRSRTKAAFLNSGFPKRSKTSELLGCEWDFLKVWIESQFPKGMTWKNRYL